MSERLNECQLFDIDSYSSHFITIILSYMDALSMYEGEENRKRERERERDSE